MQESFDTKSKGVTLETIRLYNKTSAFTDRKLTDMPTDDLQVVPRKFVTLNGVVASRPTSSVAVLGQSYFAVDTKIPMVFDGTSWRNGVGSVVAS